ncbi:MAG: UvrD-helicase domain-containing protein [Desulfomonile tiedjei]|uniref:DNA 3'-5' helicase n=1 Tax=Desulfomonile tiedjei TaxID=2358 RepID=A0A9D6Z1K3_9BACT|nr:UvrD-helicase domain-containing protein [Desulfomonile tiedjei]
MNPKNQNSLTDEKDRAAIREELAVCMMVEAAAGTGKTTMMVDRMIALLQERECSIHELAAVTFTRKAAAELRSRFQLKLEEKLRDPAFSNNSFLLAALANIEKCFVGTIHSFCARLLRERPIEAGVEISFREIDEDEDSIFRNAAWDDYFARLNAAGDPLLAELRNAGLAVNDLQEAFNRYAGFPDVPEWPVEAVDPVDFAVVKKMIEGLGSHAQQIAEIMPHEDQDELMRRYSRAARMINRADLDSPPDLIAVLKELRWKKSPGIEPDKWPVGGRQAKEEKAGWEDYHNDASKWLDHLSRASYPLVLKTIQPVRALYDRLRAEAGVLNYQDLLVKAADLLRDKPHVRAYFKKRFKKLLVDEFQDTDPIQAEVMMLLTAIDPAETDWEKCEPESGSLFVVGDPKQSIYRFRRADIVTYTKVKEILTKSGGKIVHLQNNFRSSPPIIEWVNGVFQGRFKGPSEYEPEYVGLLTTGSQDPGAAWGVQGNFIPADLTTKDAIVEYESDLIARFIVQAVENKTPMPRKKEQIALGWEPHARFDDFLIVTMRKDRLGVYASKLQKYGIPHQVTGGDALNQAAEIALLKNCVSAATQPDNPVALVAALRSELFGISDDALYWFKRGGGEFSFLSEVPASFHHPEAAALSDAFTRLNRYWELFKALPPVAAMESTVADMGLAASAAMVPEGNARAGSLLKVVELLRPMQGTAWTVSELLDYIQTIQSSNEKRDAIPAREDDKPFVRVMNLHKVKGLEAPIVFLADPSGANDSHVVRFHIDRSKGTPKGYLALRDPNWERERYAPSIAMPADWESLEKKERAFQDAESTRLLYVAATRASHQLIVSQRTDSNFRYNPWKSFREALQKRPTFSLPGHFQAPSQQPIEILDAEVATAEAKIRDQWNAIFSPTYHSAGVKQLTVDHAAFPRSEDGRGVKWGSAIHSMLQTAMIEDTEDLAAIARSTLLEEGFDKPDSLVKDAVETVRSVMASSIWQRAKKSPKCMVEVPFEIVEKTVDAVGKQIDTILRGAIDLVFLEDDKWVIVDYKTDSPPKDQLPALVELYRGQVRKYAEVWERMTGAKASECGLYFAHYGEYIIC